MSVNTFTYIKSRSENEWLKLKCLLQPDVLCKYQVKQVKRSANVCKV